MMSSEDARAPVQVIARARRWRRPAFALAGASVVALIAITSLHRQQVEPRSGAPCPMDRAALEDAFKRHAVDPGPWVALLIPDEQVTRFAREIAGGATDAEGKSRALMAGVRKLFDGHTLVRASLAETRDAAVRTPSEVLTALARKDSSVQVYPLELAALVAAGLRSLGEEAMLIEVLRAAGERALPDPSGLIGYYAVTYAGADGTSRNLDPWQAAELPDGARTEVVSDTAAVGAAMALSALDAAIFRMDTERALRLSGDALALAGHLPTVRSARGVVVLGARMAEQALQELEAARQLRPDAARMHNAATVYLLLGDNDRADALLAQAIAAAPELAAAYVTRAALFEARHQSDAAAGALARAEELAPSLGTLQLALAERDLRFGMPDEALARAARAVNERPAFDARLRLAMLQRQAARYAAMRTNAQAILAGTPAYRRDEVRDILRVALGPTALEVVEELESGAATGASTPASDGLAVQAIPVGP